MSALITDMQGIAISPFVYAIAGAVLTLITQSLAHKRGVFTYQVFHRSVGMSTDDPVYGSVRVTWNDNKVSDLCFSVVEVVNESMKDYSDVVICVHSNDTILLTESAAVLGSVRHIGHSDDYKSALAVAPGEQPSGEQFEIYRSRREFVVPSINRGQTIRLSLLNVPIDSGKGPSIWVDIQHQGITCRFKEPRIQILGIDRNRAAIVGTLAGLVGVWYLANGIENNLVIAIVSFLVGWMALILGLGLVWAFRKLREWLFN